MEFDKLLSQQTINARYIKNFLANFEKLGKVRHTQSTVKARQKLLEEYWHKFQSANSNLYSLVDATALSSEEYFTNDEYSQIELIYTTHLAALEDMLANMQVAETVSQQNSSTCKVTMPHIPLPAIKLPSFNGSAFEWESFRDLFTALIHSKAELTNVQKLHYLKCNLKGEAEQLLRNVKISDANYVGAWDTLVKRYDNNRLLVNSHLNRLFSLPKMSTGSSLKQVYDGTMEVVRALENLNRPINRWDDILIFITVQRFDGDTRREWETSIGSHQEMPTFEELEEFMASRIQVLDALHATSSKPPPSRQSRNLQSMFVDTQLNNKCTYCQKGGHPMWACISFKRQPINKRREFVQMSQVCFNCLKTGHRQADCLSKFSCRHCDQLHHTLLHLKSSSSHDSAATSTTRNKLSSTTGNSTDTSFATPPAACSTILSSSTPNTSANTSVNAATFSESIYSITNNDQRSSFAVYPGRAAPVLLATARLYANNGHGTTILLRALIDPGSEVTLISESAVQRLNLHRTSGTLAISGIGGLQAGRTRGKTTFIMNSLIDQQFSIEVTAFIMPELTKLLPSKEITTFDWNYVASLPMADPSFATPDRVDLLIGADIYVLLLCDGVKRGPPGSPIALETKLGWILSGPTHGLTGSASAQDEHLCHLSVTDDDEKLSDQLKQFWELESIGAEPSLSEEELHCEQHFATTHSRTTDGRYVVRLPFRPTCSIDDLGLSRHISVHRMRSLNQRLLRDPVLHTQYTKFMNEYATLHHMVATLPQLTSSYYLPHHGVIKPSSTSTKLRVVFNASQPSTSGKSLNDLLCIGPKLQCDLHDLIIRWRTYYVVYTADIEKMYRQILVHKDDTTLQRIIWSPGTGAQMQDYCLQTVTYGTTCAPYLALRTLGQLANDEKDQFPKACNVLKNDFYVDDVLSGADNEEQALLIQAELIDLLRGCGFTLKKWSSNRKSLLEAVPEEFRECNSPLSLNPTDHVKTLGLYWYPLQDTYQYKVNITDRTSSITKRNLVSDVAKLYDPIGLVAPVVIAAKLIIQELWQHTNIGWDDPLPDSIATKWTDYRDNLKTLEQLSVKRWLGTHGNHQCELHGFSDASSKAFAAAVYMRAQDASGLVQVSLICSKTKVAPLKIISVPRLELCGAELLAQLMVKVQKAFNLKFTSIHAWSDSTIVLCWLKKEPNAWKTFVGNRVSHIQQLIPASHWNHVVTTDNPSDVATRGLTPLELAQCNLWWSGPQWLAQPSHLWPKSSPSAPDNVDLELRSSAIVAYTDSTTDSTLVERFSSLTMLLKVTAWIRRFIANVKQ